MTTPSATADTSGAPDKLLRRQSARVTESLILAALYLDPHTKRLLQKIARARDATSTQYSNSDLAAQLLRSEHLKLTEGHLGGLNRAVIQRLALLGRMFGAIARDPNLPLTFKKCFENLRFPLIKSALADSSFFSQRVHPLRTIADDLLRRAAQSRMSGRDAEQRLLDVVQHVGEVFDLNAGFVRPALGQLPPLPAEIIDRFLVELDEDRKEGEINRYHTARDRVNLLIESRMFGAELPPLLHILIRGDWSAVLIHRLLSHGPDSEIWRDGMDVLDGLLQYAPAAEDGEPIPDSLLRRIDAGLREVNAPDGMGFVLLRALRKLTAWLLVRSPLTEAPTIVAPVAPAPASVAEQDHLPELVMPTASVEPEAAPAAPPPEPAEHLELAEFIEPRIDSSELAVLPDSFIALMREGSWFRIYDHEQQRIRWLKLESCRPVQNSLLFAGFDAGDLLTMQAGVFLDDLRQGRAAPASPDVETRGLLATLLGKT